MAFRKALTVPKPAISEQETASKRLRELARDSRPPQLGKRTKPLSSAPSLGGRGTRLRKPGR